MSGMMISGRRMTGAFRGGAPAGLAYMGSPLFGRCPYDHYAPYGQYGGTGDGFVLVFEEGGVVFAVPPEEVA